MVRVYKFSRSFLNDVFCDFLGNRCAKIGRMMTFAWRVGTAESSLCATSAPLPITSIASALKGAALSLSYNSTLPFLLCICLHDFLSFVQHEYPPRLPLLPTSPLPLPPS